MLGWPYSWALRLIVSCAYQMVNLLINIVHLTRLFPVYRIGGIELAFSAMQCIVLCCIVMQCSLLQERLYRSSGTS